MLRAGDDLVLELARDVAEVVAVAGDADDQVAVLLRVRLRLAERIGGALRALEDAGELDRERAAALLEDYRARLRRYTYLER